MQKLLSGKKRLPGFRSEWKSFQLGELVKISKGEQLNVMDMIHDGLFYVQNGGIEPSGFTDTWNCDVNTITISEGGNSCGFVKFHKEKFWYGGHCYAILNLRENLNLGFLFQLLKFKEPELMKLRVGSGLPNIQKKDIEHFILSIPSKSEQIGISNLLNLIDNEIEILKKKFDSIHQQKKGLMQVLLTGKKRITIN
jgi:type I restriction enzyme S subunit